MKNDWNINMLRLIAYGIEKIIGKKVTDYSDLEYSHITLMDFHKELFSIYNTTDTLQNSILSVKLLHVRSPLDWIALRCNLFDLLAKQHSELKARDFVKHLDDCLSYSPDQNRPNAINSSL